MADSKSSSISDIPRSLQTQEKESAFPAQHPLNENNYPTLPTKENTLAQQTRSSQRLDTLNQHKEQGAAPPSRIIGGLKSIISRIVRLILSIIIILLNSILLCYGTNYIFGKYLFVSHSIHFTLGEANTLISSIFFNCTRQTHNKHKHCNQLSTAKYTIILFLEFANRVHTSETDNIPIEFKVHTKGNSINSYEQLFYFEKLETLAETMNKLLLSPLRFLGFFNNRKERIELVELYDNSYEPIEKAEVIIKKTDLNIHKAVISFKPMNGWISTFYAYFKFIILIPLFFFFCLIQMGLLVLLRCTVRHLFQKKLKAA